MDSQCRVRRDREADSRPIAYGYVRMDEGDEGTCAPLRLNVAACCQRDELRLLKTFCDLGCDGSTLARPALANLLEALKVTPNAVLVVPDHNHLSPHESIRSALLLLLHRTEHRLVVIQDANGRAANLGEPS